VLFAAFFSCVFAFLLTGVRSIAKRGGCFQRRLFVCVFVTGSNARSATCRYLIYSEADFEVSRPAGATHAKFHPIGATTRV